MGNSYYRAITFLVGLSAISFGFALIIRSELGNDTIGVLAQGISLQTGLTIGNGSQIINLAGIAIIIACNRKLIGVGSLVSAVGIGMLLDFCLLFILPANGIGLQLLYLAVGIAIGGIGISLTIFSNCGASPVDSLMLLMFQKWHLSMKSVRIGMDITMSILGWMMGGRVGLGTIVTALCIGPVIQYGLHLLNKVKLFQHMVVQKDIRYKK